MPSRKHPRIPTAIPINISYIGSERDKKKGFVSDISIRGMSVDSPVDFDTNKEILLEINVPIEITTRVIRVSQIGSSLYRYGLKYTKLGLLNRLRFRSYINKWLKTANPAAYRGV